MTGDVCLSYARPTCLELQFYEDTLLTGVLILDGKVDELKLNAVK